ncbi:uroporphyrinogen-III synthase [Ruegeria pomeroyi]|nr:uroporphyrinogen-III synthase [Ruegeria pomeroyi]
MTRPRGASERFVAGLRPEIRAALTPIFSPLLRIEPTVEALDFGSAAGLIFTSSNGVGIAARLTVDRSLPCFCVGRATTRMAAQAGWSATMAGESAEALIAGMLARRPETPLLHLRGEHGRGEVAANLTRMGLRTGEQVIYAQRLLPFSDEAQRVLTGDKPVIAPVFSPRTARQFAELLNGTPQISVVAMSEAVKKPFENIKLSDLIVAKTPDADAMRDAIEIAVTRAIRVEGRPGAH